MDEEKKTEEQKQEEKANKLILKLQEKMEALSLQMERTNIKEYVELTHRPWKVIMYNFIGGIGRGFGIAIGMTLIAAFVIVVLTRVLSHLITLPFIGQQIAQLVDLVNQYLQEGSKLNIKNLQ